MSVAVFIKNVKKQFGNRTIIADLSLAVQPQEFFTLLGPSGCGKTTLLRMIAGFNTIEAGEILFDTKKIKEIPAHKRNIGMVFQNYAIFPHLTVRKNIEYGLKLRKISNDEIARKVDEILDIVKIRDYAGHLPEKLSGGQQQRVALARAMVIHPDILLMDEPLSNLDAKLRLEMRESIRDLQKSAKITTIYVTHDQEEALAVSDRIAVMNAGMVQQVDTPYKIYARPANKFVASFIGSSNFFKGLWKKTEKQSYLLFNEGFKLDMDTVDTATEEGEVIISIRPEELIESDYGLEVEIIDRTFLGRVISYRARLLKDTPLEADYITFTADSAYIQRLYNSGEKLFLLPNSRKINLFTPCGEKSLMKNEGMKK
jgi:iron(III) transport system ATP-binding protein